LRRCVAHCVTHCDAVHCAVQAWMAWRPGSHAPVRMQAWMAPCDARRHRSACVSIAHGCSLYSIRLQAWMTAVLVFCIFAFTDADGAVPDGAGPATIGATVRGAPHGVTERTHHRVRCRVHHRVRCGAHWRIDCMVHCMATAPPLLFAGRDARRRLRSGHWLRHEPRA